MIVQLGLRDLHVQSELVNGFLGEVDKSLRRDIAKRFRRVVRFNA